MNRECENNLPKRFINGIQRHSRQVGYLTGVTACGLITAVEKTSQAEYEEAMLVLSLSVVPVITALCLGYIEGEEETK